MKRLIITILSAVILTSGAAAYDNNGGARKINISMPQGLASNTVRNIIQDKYGFIFFGTDKGLCSYDGVSIRKYLIPDNGVDQYISSLTATDNGILAGTSKGLFLLDCKTETFSRLLPEITSQVNCFTSDREGNIWIATSSQGIFKYTPGSAAPPTAYPMKELAGNITMIFADNNNQIWASPSGGTSIYRLDKAKNSFRPAQFKGAGYDYSIAMIQTADGRIWFGTWSQGLMLLEDDGSLRQIISPSASGTANHIHALYEIAPSTILIGCDDGLIAYDTRKESWSRVPDAAETAVSDRFVYSILCDNEGGLWYGTFYGGVNYISPTSVRFESYQQASSTGASLPSFREGAEKGAAFRRGRALNGNVISRFCEDKSGRVWIASDDGGLNCFLPAEQRFADFPAESRLARKNIHALCADGDELWIGTYSEGIVRMNTVSGDIHTYTTDDGIPDNSSYDIYIDEKGRMWAATMNALCLYDRQTDRFKAVKELGAMGIDIISDGGSLWVATQGNGLWRYSQDGKWKQYKHGDKAASLPDNQVNSFCVDAGGTMWIATSSGLCRYNPKEDNFTTVRLNIPSNDISSIIADDPLLWLSTTNGIVRFVNADSVQLFNRYDGIIGEQFQPNSGMKTADGRIFFGSVNGFSTFYPHKIKINNKAPKVYITALEIYNKPIEVGSKKLPEALNQIKQLDLGWQDGMFSLSFAALSYCSPEKNQYAYMLEGLDKDWNYVGSQAKASYTNVSSGTYLFRVKATNNDGVWSEEEATLKIVVHPPFWWSLPAKILYLLLILYLIYLYTQLRLKKAERRHQRELAHIDEQRTAEERDARLKFFTMVAHEIRTPVSLIIGPLENVISKSTDSGVAKDLNIIDRNAHRLLDLVNQLLDFNKVQQKGMQMRFSLQSLSALLASVAERFAPTLEQKGARLEVKYPDPDISALIDKEGVTKIVSNLMTNATKYTKDFVSLSCEAAGDNEHFRIIVEDNGVGISDEEQKNIFNEFYQAKDNKPGTGIGLSIVKNLVQLHHGEVAVESEKGKGSKFVITLPLKQENVEVAAEEKKDMTTDRGTAPSPAPAGNKTKGDTVLLVEDDEDMLHFLSGNFGKDYAVITAANGKEGLEQLKHHNVTLIVSDWMMPEMDGAEMCRRIRADRNTSHIPLIMLTAKTDNDSKAESMDCGADAFIEKPFSMKYLESCIRNLIDMRRRLMQKFSATADIPISSIAGNEVDNELLEKMNTIIEENINNSQLSVNFVAEQLGISRSGLFAKIKSLADVTPNEMIQIVRLKKAATLLAGNKYRVNEVCYMVGFSSPSYFTKCFQKQFGVKPAEYVSTLRQHNATPQQDAPGEGAEESRQDGGAQEKQEQ